MLISTCYIDTIILLHNKSRNRRSLSQTDKGVSKIPTADIIVTEQARIVPLNAPG